MKFWTRTLAIALTLALLAPAASAAILDGTNDCTVKLSDGTDVVLYGEFVSKIGRRAAPRQLLPVSRRQNFGVSPDVLAKLKTTAASRLQRNLQQAATKKHQLSHRFYYLPPSNSIRLATRPEDGVPEFLFVKYTTEERADAGGIQGGLLHFLMEWSLTTEQEAELRKKVAEQCKAGGKPGELIGAVELAEAEENGSFRIISATLGDEGLTRSLVQSGHAPTMPGGRIAAAANLDKNGAQLFLATVEKSRSIADLSVTLDFSYVVQMPGAKGEIIYNWEKVRELGSSYSAQSDAVRARAACDLLDLGCHLGNLGQAVSDAAVGTGQTLHDAAEAVTGADQKHTYTEAQTRRAFDRMVETGVVEFNFEGYQTDSAYTASIMDAMHQVFVNRIMEPVDDGDDLNLPSDGPGSEDEETPSTSERFNLSNARERHYTINQTNFQRAYASKTEYVKLDYGLAVEKPVQVTGNLASWYDANEDNPNCVQTVNLNDPFFEHREVRFIVDLDAREVFEDMINYVTVNVRKKREESTNFERSVTIDQEHLKNKGVMASLTYARETDEKSDLYYYRTQWSVRGGNLYPAKPKWKKGKWEGVTLAAPIERWNIEVEGDLDQMAENDIARVTVELHYPLFGVEEYKVLAVSPTAGEPLVSDTIYVDQGTRGFAYRLILHHKKEGRLVLPWQTRVGDRYVFATIPDDYLHAGDLREHAKAAAKNLGDFGNEQVLNQFQELFSGAD